MKKPPKVALSIVLGVVGFFLVLGGAQILGALCLAIAIAPWLREMTARRAQEKQEQKQHEADQRKRHAEADAMRLKDQAEKAEAEARDKAFQAEQKAISEGAAAQKLRGMVNELFELINMLKPEGDNRQIVTGIHEVVGRILADSDIRPEHYQDKGIQTDVGFILEHLKSAGLANDIVYRRAEKVLVPDLPPTSPPIIAGK